MGRKSKRQKSAKSPKTPKNAHVTGAAVATERGPQVEAASARPRRLWIVPLIVVGQVGLLGLYYLLASFWPPTAVLIAPDGLALPGETTELRAFLRQDLPPLLRARRHAGHRASLQGPKGEVLASAETDALGGLSFELAAPATPGLVDYRVLLEYEGQQLESPTRLAVTAPERPLFAISASSFALARDFLDPVTAARQLGYFLEKAARKHAVIYLHLDGELTFASARDRLRSRRLPPGPLLLERALDGAELSETLRELDRRSFAPRGGLAWAVTSSASEREVFEALGWKTLFVHPKAGGAPAGAGAQASQGAPSWEKAGELLDPQ